MLVVLIIFCVFVVLLMKCYDVEVGFDFIWNSLVVKKNGVGVWLLVLVLGVVVLVMFISLGMIVINLVVVVSVLVYVIVVFVVFYFIWLFVFVGFNCKEWVCLLVCFILLVLVVFFWFVFEQKLIFFNLFVNDYINWMIGDFEIFVVWFQLINVLFIIFFVLVFSWVWFVLVCKNVCLGSMIKFVIGILCVVVGFGLMMLVVQNVLSNGGVGVLLLWLVGSILMLMFGELCFSLIGLVIMILLVLERMCGQMMGLWFCVSVLGNLVVGLIGGYVKVDQLLLLLDFFVCCFIVLLICVVVLVVLIVLVCWMLENSWFSVV